VFAQFVAASCSRGDFGWVYVEADGFYLRPQLQPTAQGGKLSYVNGERTLNEDLVVWYGVHLRKRGADTFECPPLGPDIYLSG
jgi:hypothetical protein